MQEKLFILNKFVVLDIKVMIMKYMFLLSTILLVFSSCKNQGSAANDTGVEFDSAYPEIYSNLGLPQFRRGTLESVTGKNEGVKTTHNVVIITDDDPNYVRDFIEPAMKELGWRDLNSRKRLSSSISDDDLFFASYVKGTNKFDINASTTPIGKTKIKIALSVFGSN